MLKAARRESTAPFAWAFAALSLGLAACDDNGGKTDGATAPREQRRAEVAPRQTAPERPPAASPGAGPSVNPLIGTWTVTEFKGGPADGRGDRAESTTYRFEEGGRVTVAGSRQCAYALQDRELKVDCHGRITAGRIEYRGGQTILWSIGGDQIVTLVKR